MHLCSHTRSHIIHTHTDTLSHSHTYCHTHTTHTHIHNSNTHSHTYTLTQLTLSHNTYTHSLIHTVIYTVTHSHTHTLTHNSHSHPHTVTHTVTHIHSHTLSLTHIYSLSHIYTLTHTHCHTPSHTDTRAASLCLRCLAVSSPCTALPCCSSVAQVSPSQERVRARGTQPWGLGAPHSHGLLPWDGGGQASEHLGLQAESMEEPAWLRKHRVTPGGPVIPSTWKDLQPRKV